MIRRNFFKSLAALAVTVPVVKALASVSESKYDGSKLPMLHQDEVGLVEAPPTSLPGDLPYKNMGIMLPDGNMMLIRKRGKYQTGFKQVSVKDYRTGYNIWE